MGTNKKIDVAEKAKSLQEITDEEQKKRIELKKSVLKESEEILNSRKKEYIQENIPENTKYSKLGNDSIGEFHCRYMDLLDNYLISKGIQCNGVKINRGKWTYAKDIISGKEDMVSSLCEISCRGMDFIFDERFKRLWLAGDMNEEEGQWCDRWAKTITSRAWYKRSKDYLAVLATDTEMYVLFQSGKVKSTDPDFEEVYLFNKIEEARRICAELPNDKILDAALTIEEIDEKKSSNYGFIHPYYSWELKSFIDGFKDGSLDTGIYAHYYSKSKEYMLENYLVDQNLYEMWLSVKEGNVPRFAALDCLPEDETVDYHNEKLIY